MTHSYESSGRMRKLPQQKRSAAKVARILDVSNECFADNGFHGASTVEIAKQAQVSVGTLYRFYPNKEAIASELIEQFRVRSLTALTPLLDEIATVDDVPAGVASMVRMTAAIALEHPGYYAISAVEHPDDPAASTYETRQVLVAAIADKIAAIAPSVGDEAGLIAHTCAETTRHFLHQAWRAPDRPTRVAELERLLVAYTTDRLAAHLG